jgi:hypothetical protein
MQSILPPIISSQRRGFFRHRLKLIEMALVANERAKSSVNKFDSSVKVSAAFDAVHEWLLIEHAFALYDAGYMDDGNKKKPK